MRHELRPPDDPPDDVPSSSTNDASWSTFTWVEVRDEDGSLRVRVGGTAVFVTDLDVRA